MKLRTLALLLLSSAVTLGDARADTLQMLVMDPLSKPLSCPCVEGYAQRDYQPLAELIERRTGRTVQLEFAESIEGASRPDLVIGKHSVVVADAASAGLPMVSVAQLTGKDGQTTQTGLLVVRAADEAQRVADLSGYRILFGPVECEEKHGAAVKLLQQHGITVSAEREVSAACSDGACRLIEWGDTAKAAAVISSYAQPLLEGCGTIQKGDLRVVGETEPVAFITAFVRHDLAPEVSKAITAALLEAGQQPQLLQSLESALGFLPVEPTSEKKKN